MLDLNRIYLDEAFDGMSGIDAGCVDMVVTDPPYALGCSNDTRKPTIADYSIIKPFFQKLLSEADRVLKDDGCAYFFCDWRTYPFLYQFLPYGLKPKNLIVWDKMHMGPGSYYRYNHELILFCAKKGHKRLFDGNKSDILRFPRYGFLYEDTDGKVRPTQKAVKLLEILIQDGSREGGLVLDPFMGSGSSAIACLETGRDFLGFELDERHYTTAVERIERWQKENARNN